jgi:hypothetical protein
MDIKMFVDELFFYLARVKTGAVITKESASLFFTELYK